MDVYVFRRLVIFLNLSIIAWAVLASPANDLLYHFQENRLVTFFSAFQLICIALLCFLIFDTAAYTHKIKPVKKLEEHHHYVWLLVALGFLYLSFDEVLMLHEKLDFSFHHLYQMEENSWSDRIDDMIILTYVVIALLVLYKYQSDLKDYKNNIIPYLKPGFSLILLMICLDLLTNRNDLINTRILFQILSALEETCNHHT